MKHFFAVMILFFSSLSLAKSTGQKVYEILAESTLQEKVEPPLTIEVKDVLCNHGSTKNAFKEMKCRGQFTINGKTEEKEIKKPLEFFKLLEKRGAIANGEMRMGESRYETGLITCTYDRFASSYYSCQSKPTVRF